MTHRSFAHYGNHLANEWGHDDEGDLRLKIQRMTDDQRICCLLAAAVRELRRVTAGIDNVESAIDSQLSESPTSSPVDDGMLRWLSGSIGDKPIDDMDKSSLSVRARKVLKRSELKFRSQVTRELLAGVKNCGEITIRELTEWASGQPSAKRQK